MRVARYLCTIAVLLTACSTTTSTPVASPSPTAPTPSVSASLSETSSPTPDAGPLSVRVPAPSNLVAGFGSLWARSGSSLWQISEDGRVVARIPNVFSPKPAAVGPQNLAVGLGSVWTVTPRSVLRIDPSTQRVTGRIAVPSGCDDIAPGAGVMLLACRDSRLYSIGPSSNTATVATTVGVTPVGIAYGSGAVWWINFSEGGGITKIEPSSGSKASLPAPFARFVVPTQHHIWFLDANGNAFSMDASGSRPSRSVKKARVALGVTFAHGTVMINDGDLVAFDADTGNVTQRADVSGKQSDQAIAGIAVLDNSVWLVDPKDHRIVAVPR